jgi:nucleotide-binding universal stress UspA family protein
MTRIRRILFPHDLSASTAKVIPYLRTTARALNCEVYMLHVVPSIPKWGNGYIPLPSTTVLELEAVESAKKFMERIRGNATLGCAVAGTKVTSGDPVREILKAVNEGGIDMIVMGTHGRKGLKHIIMGSVAEGVVRKAPVPVMIVNPSAMNGTFN